MTELSDEEKHQQLAYRDARVSAQYDKIWQTTGKCVFCDLKEKYILFEENGVVLTISLFAYIDGHMMIIPRQHVRSAKELSVVQWDTIRKFTYLAKTLIRDVHGIKGVQYILRDGGIVAQSTVSDHLHVHTIPFDDPDLSVWNYRQLKHTPLENVALYKKSRKKLVEADMKFEKKYANPVTLPISLDAIVLNKKGEVLLTVRKEGMKLQHGYKTLPGGRVDNTTRTLEEELSRELREEIGYEPPAGRLRLLGSRIGSKPMLIQEPHLKVSYPRKWRHLWNTYLLENFDSRIKLSPGDDCEDLIWVPVNEVKKHLTPEAQEAFTWLKR